MATLPTIAGYHASPIAINDSLTPAAGDTAHATTYTLPATPSNGEAPQVGDIIVCSFINGSYGNVSKLVTVTEPGTVTAVPSGYIDTAGGAVSYGLYLYTYTGSNTVNVTVNNDTGRTSSMTLRVFWVRGVSALADVVVGAAQNRRSHDPVVTTAVFPQPIVVPARQAVLGVDIAAERTVAAETASQITDVDATTLAEVYPNSSMVWLTGATDQTVSVFHGDISHLRGSTTTEHRINYPNSQNYNALALQLAFPAADTISGHPIKISNGAGLVDAWYKVSDGGGNLSTPGGHRTVNPGYSSVTSMLAANPFFVASQGVSDTYPEMSLYAYGQSVLRGYGAVQLSLARTSDGVWFGLQDQDLNRTSGTTGLAAASTMTWEQVQQYQILGSTAIENPTQPNRPYMQFEELMALYYPSHVIFIDARFAHAHLSELITKLNALPGTPTNHIVGMGYGPSGSLGDAFRAAGYRAYGYYYQSDYTNGNLASSQSHWDILGMGYGSSQVAWNAVASYGKPAIAHSCSAPAHVTTARERGATGIMSSSMAIDPTIAYDLIANYRYSFEAGPAGATVSTAIVAAGDNAWNAVSVGTGAAFQYSTTHVAHGALSAMLAPGTAATPQGRWSFSTPSLKGSFRYYVWWDANPTADTYPVWFGSSSSARTLNLSVLPTGVLRLMGTAGVLYSTPASTLPLGGWTRIEIAFEIDSTTPANGRSRLAVYSGDSNTPLADSDWVTGNLGSAGVTYVRVGKYSSDTNTETHWLDSVAYRAGSSTMLGAYTDPTP